MLGLLAEAAILLEDRESVEVLAARISPLASLSVLPLHGTTACPARVLGGAAALLGKPDEARSYYFKALETAGKIRFRPEIALTRLELAKLLLDHYLDPSTGSGQARAEALEHLDFAIGELRDMKMQPALERALSRREILGGVGAHRDASLPGLEGHGGSMLTRRRIAHIGTFELMTLRQLFSETEMEDLSTRCSQLAFPGRRPERS